METYAYAAPPPQTGRREDWDGTVPVVIPAPLPGATTTFDPLEGVPAAGLRKLLARLKGALRNSDAKLDMDEVGAMVWLEGLR